MRRTKDFFLGEHGWFDKRFMYEESLKTPLLVRWSGVAKAGMVNEQMVSNLDFAQTFLDLAGIEQPSDMQGQEPETAVRRARNPPTGGSRFIITIIVSPSTMRCGAMTGLAKQSAQADAFLRFERMGTFRSWRRIQWR